MKHTIYKVFTVAEFEKEENWLNEMSAKGLQLTDIGFCRYVFEEGIHGEYVYRLELLENMPTHPESIAYIRFMEEMGVEHVGSILRWVYFRKKASDTPFDLYSDLDSRIRHFRRINLLCNWLIGINLVVGVINLLLFAGNIMSRYMGAATGMHYTNSVVGSVNLAIAVLIFVLARPIRMRLKKMQKENAVRE